MAWVGTPVGTVATSMLLYPLLGRFLDSLHLDLFTRDLLLKWGVVTAGCYGAYALGAATFSRNVMITVGKRLVKLDPFSAFIAVFSMALVVRFSTTLGVPVSTSQGILGALLGIGLLKGMQTIRARTLVHIAFG